MTKQEIIEILRENRVLIENNNFEEFYNRLSPIDIHHFTDLFLKSGMNPLNYMEAIPHLYAYKLENLKNIIIPNNIKKNWRLCVLLLYQLEKCRNSK